MIRVFFNTQPDVLSLLGLYPDNTDFDFRTSWCGRVYYLAKHGPGWVLYRPSLFTVSDAVPPTT